ncbi:MAG: hypothetical protein CMP73_00835 [Flavobacteriales bacterium]|nr:hypothetical protein [Flavobacteriales bacterium]
MKKYYVLYLLILCLFSCETIEAPYMVENSSVPVDTSNNYIKKILIEEFTAHKCANCPSAAEQLKAIYDLYPQQIIGIAIHAKNSFSTPTPTQVSPSGFTYDFRTPFGSYIYENIMESCPIPQGMVNRIGYPEGDHKLLKTQWLDVVENERLKEVNLGIQINPNITSNSGEINILIDIINNINGSYKLAVVLVENNIINWQINGDFEVNNYEHNHVLRTSIYNDFFSSNLNYISGDKINKSISLNIDNLQQENITYSNSIEDGNGNAGEWNINNMSIIAYIYNSDTYEVIQVEEVKLTNTL